MAVTPEGKIKKLVTSLLRQYEPEVWFTMPVPYGYGESTLDYIGCACGQFFAVETKAPGNKPTQRQEIIISKMRSSGGKVFVIDGDYSLQELKEWLSDVARR